MGTKNNPDGFDCYRAAHPDEPVFTLIGSDPLAPALVESWAYRREAADCGPSERVNEARATAEAMRDFRSRGPVVRERRFTGPGNRVAGYGGGLLRAVVDRRGFVAVERREFEPRRQSVNWTSWRRRLTDCAIICHDEAERRKAQNSNQARRQGPADRRDFEKVARSVGERIILDTIRKNRSEFVYFGTPTIPKHETRRVVTVGGPNYGKTASFPNYPVWPTRFFDGDPDDRVPGQSTSRRGRMLGRRDAFRKDQREGERREWDEEGRGSRGLLRRRFNVRIRSGERRRVEVDVPAMKLKALPTFAATGRRKSTDERRTHDAPGKKLARQKLELFQREFTSEEMVKLVRELTAPSVFPTFAYAEPRRDSIVIERKERRDGKVRRDPRLGRRKDGQRSGIIQNTKDLDRRDKAAANRLGFVGRRSSKSTNKERRGVHPAPLFDFKVTNLVTARPGGILYGPSDERRVRERRVGRPTHRGQYGPRTHG